VTRPQKRKGLVSGEDEDEMDEEELQDAVEDMSKSS
jgi:hypothetical protein